MRLKIHVPLLWYLLVFFALSVPTVQSFHNQPQPSSSIHATVRLSVCGNQVAETGEECDQVDTRGATCMSVGFESGALQCHPSCTFDVQSCQTPVTRTTVDEFSIFFTNGIFDIPSWASSTYTPSFNVIEQTIIQARDAAEASFVTLPENLVVERHDGGFFDATALTVAELNIRTMSGFQEGMEAKAAMQWGISNARLAFSLPVTIHMAVDPTLNNQTLSIVRSATGTSGWTSDGIVLPATCVVTGGICTFQVTMASYFATVVVPDTSSSSSTSTSTSSSTSESSSTTTSSSDSPASSPTPTRRITRRFISQPTDMQPESGAIPTPDWTPREEKQEVRATQPSRDRNVLVSTLQRVLMDIWRYVRDAIAFMFRSIVSWLT